MMRLEVFMFYQRNHISCLFNSIYVKLSQILTHNPNPKSSHKSTYKFSKTASKKHFLDFLYPFDTFDTPFIDVKI